MSILNPRMKTPCIGICSTTVGDMVCRGCHRTRAEIDGWNGFTEAEKDAVWARLEKEHGIKRGENRHPRHLARMKMQD